MYFIVHNGQNLLQCYNPGKKFKMAITRLYIAKSTVLRRNSIGMHKSSPRNMLQILATQIGHVLYST